MTLEETKESGAVELGLCHRYGLFFGPFDDGDTAPLTPLQTVVLLQVVNNGHVEDFTAFVFVPVIAGSQF